MTYPQRPVDEVVLALAIDDVQALSGPKLGLVFQDVLQQFPKIEAQPPVEMQLELPLEKQSLLQVGPRIEVVGMGSAPRIRSWFISTDDTRLIQVQPDFLAFNWRRRPGIDQPYPGYLSLRNSYEDLVARIDNSLRALDEPELKARQAELTYVNILRPDDNWHTHSEVHRVVRINFPAIDLYERLNFGYTRALEGSGGSFAGRLYVMLQPAVDTATQVPVVNLTLTARSAAFDDASLTRAFDFLDLGHAAVTAAFQSLITQDARDAWGLT